MGRANLCHLAHRFVAQRVKISESGIAFLLEKCYNRNKQVIFIRVRQKPLFYVLFQFDNVSY